MLLVNLVVLLPPLLVPLSGHLSSFDIATHALGLG